MFIVRAIFGLNFKVVESLVLVSVTVYVRGPTAPPSSSGGCQLTVAEKGLMSLTETFTGARGGTVQKMRHSQDIVLRTYTAICSAWLTNEAVVDSIAPHTVVGTAGVVPSIP